MTDLAHARAAIELAECHTGPKPGDASVFGTKLLIVVDRREFFRDCLSFLAKLAWGGVRGGRRC